MQNFVVLLADLFIVLFVGISTIGVDFPTSLYFVFGFVGVK
jgi:hypothetical protein